MAKSCATELCYNYDEAYTVDLNARKFLASGWGWDKHGRSKIHLLITSLLELLYAAYPDFELED